MAPSAVRIASSRAGQQQVRDVRARDEQHERNGAEQDEKRRPDRLAALFRERARLQRPVARILIRVVLLQLLAERGHVARPLLHGHAGFQAPDHPEELVRALVDTELLGLERERRPQIRLPHVEVVEGRRHHADDLIRFAIELQRRAKHVRTASEEPLPQAGADDDNVITTGLVLPGQEGAAQVRRHPEHAKVARCCRERGHAFGLRAARQVCAPPRRDGVAVEDPRPLAEIAVGRYGEAGLEVVEGRVEVKHRHEPVGGRIRQGPQKHRVHDAEDRGVRADAQREGCDDDGRERRIVQQAAEGVSDIAPEHGITPRVANRLFEPGTRGVSDCASST